MNISRWLGRLLGDNEVSQIDHWQTSFGASWAHQSPALVLFLCLGAAGFAVWFYLRGQTQTHRSARLWLAALRGTVLSLVLIILADPMLEITLVSRPKPVVWLLFDGTDSLAIADELSPDEDIKLKHAVGWDAYVAQHQPGMIDKPARSDFVRALLAKHDSGFLPQLAEQFELKAFTFADTDGVRALMGTENEETIAADAGAKLAADWKTDGAVTALGDAFQDLAARHASDNLAGVIVFSDFDQNAGAPPLAAAKKLGVPIFTVGVGPLNALDLSLDLLVPPTMKAAETSTVSVTVRQREIQNQTVEVRLFARPSAPSELEVPSRILVGTQTVVLNAASATVEFPYQPSQPGRMVLEAEIDPISEESVTENNRIERSVTIIDDFLRLLYVEYEPTWEWRFIKEVFHRDKLVGTRGFRTFLRSADPVVRETNELFLPGLTSPRSEFFQTDVIFLGDMPASALSTRFCEMTKEFVSQFGGGLVVIAGPRFGPAQLANTPLADMLPVVVDAELRRNDDGEFRPQLTPLSDQYDFMRLGRVNSSDQQLAWHNLGKLSWYQPVLRPEARSTTVLAEHPTDLCADGKTKQPLIAIRKYGRGEVVYIAFNEMWRLRRLYGEEYYRQFWGQMIYRLGLSHALGSQKRFIVRTDKQNYRAGEEALITVEAFDQDYQPLDEKSLTEGRLQAELLMPVRAETADHLQAMTIPQLRPGVFETRVPVTAVGKYHLRVTDPMHQETAEVHFEVSGVSAERRSAVRNIALQKSLAAETGGKSFDLTTIATLPEEFHPTRRQEQTREVFPLWSNWFSFTIVLGLMLTEWLGRKLVNLT